MDATTTTPPAAAPAPVPTPAPAQELGAPPSINTAAPATTSTSAPAKEGSFKESFNKVISNPVSLVFGILGSATLYYAIYYFKYSNQMNKVFVKTVENKIDDLDIKYTDLSSKINRLEQSNNNIDIF